MHVPKILHNIHEYTAHYYCISYQKTLQCHYFYYFLTDYSHFMEIRSRYSNRAVTYSNTAVRKCRYTLIKQSALKHNLDFESIMLSIIGNKQFSKLNWLKPTNQMISGDSKNVNNRHVIDLKYCVRYLNKKILKYF